MDNTNLSENITETDTCNERNVDTDSIKPATVRKSCIEVLKNVQNNLYGTDDVEVLCEVREKLNEIDTYLDQQSVKMCGLPYRHKVKKMKRKQTGQTGNTVKKPKLSKTLPLDSEIISPLPEIQKDDHDLVLCPEHIPFLEGMVILPNLSDFILNFSTHC